MNSISFDEVFRLAACPYCKAEIGNGCNDKRRKPYNGKPDDSPHLSRVKIARRVRAQLANSARAKD